MINFNRGKKETVIQNSLPELTKEQKEAFKKRVLSWRQDPTLFCKDALGTDSYWEKQVEVLQSVAKHQKTTVRSGHGVGKSFCAADVVIWFNQVFENSIVITTAPTWRQVEKVLWGEVRQHFSKAVYPLTGNILETEVKIGPKWYATGFSSDAKDSFQGFHERYVLVVVDEASGVPDETLDQIDSLIIQEGHRLLYIGNPMRSSGRFAESFEDPSFNKIHISCLDSPNVKSGKNLYPSLVTKAWCDEKLEKWGFDSSYYQARVLGNIPKESEDTLIKMDWIAMAKVRYGQMDVRGIPRDRFKGIQYGIDVARQGRDKTVHLVRSENRILEIVAFQGYDTVETFNVAKGLIEKWNPENVMVDDTGVGGGVTDQLSHAGFENIVPVNAGEKADDEIHYVNKKSELAWRIREAFRLGGIDIPENEDLEFECSHQYYDHQNGRLRVMSKALLRKLVKKMTGRGKEEFSSSDYFEALCLTYEKSWPGKTLEQKAAYRLEFEDAAHIRLIPARKLNIGVSWFNVLVDIPEESSSYLLWACADRKGLVYFYREQMVPRSTSDRIAEVIKEVEEEQPRPTDLRYCDKLYWSEEDTGGRYNLLEQLSDYDYIFEETEWNEELAKINLREGLKYDKAKSMDSSNHPFVFFSPNCPLAIRAVKYFSHLKSIKENVQMQAVHKAVGLMILSEPIWLKTAYQDA